MENHSIGPLPAAVIGHYEAEIAELQKEILRLRHSEELLIEERMNISHIMKKAIDFVFLLSPDYGIHFIGDSLQQQSGEAPSSCRCHELLNHLSAPCDHCPAMKVFATGEMNSWEETLPDGHTYKVSGYPYSRGTTNLVLLVGIDISDQKLVENSFRLNEQKYKVLLKAIPDTILIVDQDCFITSFQPGPHFHSNTQSERVVGMNLKDLIPGMPADIFAGLVREVLKARKQLVYEYEIRRLDRFEEARFAWCNHNEVMIIIRDITERKQIEDALRESDTRFRILADTTSGAILIYQDEIYVYANPAATELTGFSTRELLDHKFWEIVHPEYRDLVISRAAARIVEENIPSKYSVKILHKSGENRWAEINVGITTYNSRPALIVTAFDITDHIRTEERALASLQEKEVLLKEVHHRVKNNLQIISSLLSLQSAALGDKEAALAFINSQHRIRSMALIHEMLYQSEDFSRISLSSYIQKLAYNLLRSYNVDTSKIRLHIEADQVFLDIEHAIPCGLILNELMTNSIKYAFVKKHQGNISIKLQRNAVNEKYVLTIGDDGDGLPTGIDLGHLKTLGMELVATLVEQLDGTIELERGEGTTFRITF